VTWPGGVKERSRSAVLKMKTTKRGRVILGLKLVASLESRVDRHADRADLGRDEVGEEGEEQGRRDDAHAG
jgi:hypothetical protein